MWIETRVLGNPKSGDIVTTPEGWEGRVSQFNERRTYCFVHPLADEQRPDNEEGTYDAGDNWISAMLRRHRDD